VGIWILVVVVSMIVLSWTLTRPTSAVPAHDSPSGSAPLDEAERILAARYAAGAITPQEYQRMLVILRK